MITLYDFGRAPSPRRARIFLAEKGVVHETVQIDMMKAEQMSEAYRAINPNCTIPALRLDDRNVLTDNAAIAAWAEATYPDPPLLGATPLEKAHIASWNAKLEAEGLMAIAEALRNSTPSMKDRALPGPHNFPQIPELAERGMKRLHIFFDMFNAHLANREFAITDRFSVADITAAVIIDFARVVKMSPGEQHPNLVAWHNRMKERPSMSL
jgi:glutathione S-transferase